MGRVMVPKGPVSGDGVGSIVDVVPWRLHDLRRTMRTGMAALGVPEIISEKVLNHQPTIMAKTYNVHDYTDQKRDALEKWATQVQTIASALPANVLPIRGLASNL